MQPLLACAHRLLQLSLCVHLLCQQALRLALHVKQPLLHVGHLLLPLAHLAQGVRVLPRVQLQRPRQHGGAVNQLRDAALDA
jgi:hypothetical protein